MCFSQIRRKEGRHFEAAWAENISQFLTKKSENADGYFALSSATRSLRLGNGLLAEQGLQLAERLGLSPLQKEKARLMRIHVARISGGTEECRALIKETKTDKTFHLSEDALVDYAPLMPGQTSPFSVTTTHNPLISTCVVSFKTFSGERIEMIQRE